MKHIEAQLNDTLDELVSQSEARFGKADSEDCERMATELLLQMGLSHAFRWDDETQSITRR